MRVKHPDPDTPGGRLRALRKAKKLSQVELAVIVGYDRAHLASMELNRSRGGRAAWEALAGALGTSLDFLLHGVDAPSSGFAAVGQAPIVGAPAFDPSADITRFGEVAEKVEALLREARMPHDTRTVAELAAVTWRDINLLGPRMSFDDRLDLVLSERRNALANARTAMFVSGSGSRR